jgi:hypothetical protein
MGIWHGTPDLSVGLYIWKGIIPAGLGNIVGGALFCGGYYWWMYLAEEPDVAVDGVYYERVPHLEGRKITHIWRRQVDEESDNSMSKVDTNVIKEQDRRHMPQSGS